MNSDDLDRVIAYLAGQFERGLPVLFTGAGFSLAAKNLDHSPIPTVRALKEALWNLCFPSDTFSPDAALGDLYATAQLRRKSDLQRLMDRSFTTSPDDLPAWYRLYFSMPWARSYTLNVDDLEQAVDRAFSLPRRLRSMSATVPPRASDAPETETVPRFDVIHLNGMIPDPIDTLVFSPPQYAVRLTQPDQWYIRAVADLLTRCCVFVGTQIEEPSLWQYIEYRRGRGDRANQELRPGSFLVTPTLEKPKQALLAELNVSWVPMTAEEFAQNVLEHCSAAIEPGLRALSVRTGEEPPDTVPDVATISQQPSPSTDYLLGHEPNWEDLRGGKAIERESDAELRDLVTKTLSAGGHRGYLVITGTAGSGKSTALKRLALGLAAAGAQIGWVDRFIDPSPRAIRHSMRTDNAFRILAIDDADRYGAELAAVVREITQLETNPFVLLGIRAGRVDRVLNPARLEGVRRQEHTVPPLADNDIASLLDLLEREKRLGALTGKSRLEQTNLLRDKAGRQLLVAMIEATSGEKFEERVFAEFLELEPRAARAYAAISVATALRASLSRDEVLIAIGDQTNEALNAVEGLLRRHIVAATPGSTPPTLQTRHPLIAEILLDELQRQRRLADVLPGLILAAAAKADPRAPRHSRNWRLLQRLINHDFLANSLDREGARNAYGDVETLLGWDYHYWLQRGSFEVEFGDLSHADLFLKTAAGMQPDDPLVQTEGAYLSFKRAIANPAAISASQLVDQATAALEDLIARRGRTDPYPYHVLGSQGLAWARQGIPSPAERGRYLARLLKRLEEGLARHPTRAELKQLHDDAKRRYLETALPS